MEKNLKKTLREEVLTNIHIWSKKFPIDYWWRKKYNIPYGSPAHREANLIDMMYDFEEEKIMKRLIAKVSKEMEDEDVEEMLDNTSVGKKMSKAELDDAFDNLDLDQFNIKKND